MNHFDNVTINTNNDSYQLQTKFVMHVSDKRNPHRSVCTDSITFTAIHNQNNASDPSFDEILISVTEISNEINIGDKVRIVIEIINGKVFYANKRNKFYHTIHEWKEINNLLTKQEIIDYSDSDGNSLNLILKANKLNQGITYSFQETISQYDNNNNLIGYGQSSVQTIFVLNPPMILKDSFIISPPCNNHTSYDTINDYLSTTFSLSVSADGGHPPLLYQFLHQNHNDAVYYIHPSLLSTSYINNIFLPIGDITLMVHVFDGKSSVGTDSISCDIKLNSYSQCPNESLVASYATEYDKTNQLLQKALIYLQYLFENYHSINDALQCTQKHLLSILSTLNSEMDDLCQSNFVILLSQVIELWIDLVNLNDDLKQLFYTQESNMTIVSNLILKSIDPCLFITSDIGNDVELLHLDEESVITNTVKIYYNNMDITSLLSIIITHDTYKPTFYSFAQSLIELINGLLIMD